MLGVERRGTPEPTVTCDSTQLQSITAGNDNACGLDANGRAHCWGAISSINDEPTTSFEYISVGWDFACGIKADGSGECWGVDEQGRHDIPTNDPDTLQPIEYTRIELGEETGCGVTEDGSAYCWGAAVAGMNYVPDGYEPLLDVSSGGDANLFLKTDGTVVTGGFNNNVGMMPPNNGTLKRVYAGRFFQCGLRTNSNPQCWTNASVSGIGAVEQYPSTPMFDMAVGATHACGLALSGNAVMCWGIGSNGEHDACGHVPNARRPNGDSCP